MVVAIAKAVEQVVLVTVRTDIPGGMVVIVDNCSPNRVARPLRIALSDCTANSNPPTPAVESEIVLLLRALAEGIEDALAVIVIVAFAVALIAACTTALLAVVDSLVEATLPETDIVRFSSKVDSALAVMLELLTVLVVSVD